jgi:hypothetical protein
MLTSNVKKIIIAIARAINKGYSKGGQIGMLEVVKLAICSKIHAI